MGTLDQFHRATIQLQFSIFIRLCPHHTIGICRRETLGIITSRDERTETVEHCFGLNFVEGSVCSVPETFLLCCGTLHSRTRKMREKNKKIKGTVIHKV